MTFSVKFIRWLTGLVALAVMVAGFAAVAGVILMFWVVKDLPSIPEPLRRIIETPPTEIYAANGERILQIGGHDYVPLNEVSTYFLQAILATEDHTFWAHHGVNKTRMLRAVETLFTGGRVQGASTITQQLAKNLFFSFEQTYTRKFKELLVALQIESQFSKEEILEAYINQIYIVPHTQGVGAAARLFFGKPAAELNLAEATLLAGLPKSPSRYNPLRYLERAKSRQRVVIQRMLAVGYINAEQAAAAEAEPLAFNTKSGEVLEGSYFVDYVLRGLEERYGAQVVYHGGLKVTTTMDPQLQRFAQTAVTQGVADLENIMKRPTSQDNPNDSEHLQAALVAVQVNSGAIKAMVGGTDYTQSQFNRAVENNRQPGSGFKPFLYYTALDQKGLSPATVMIDQPTKVPVEGAPDWRPMNYRRDYQGPVIIKKAFTESINSIAAQLVAQIGPEAVIRTARLCGIESPLAPVYSVALGTSGVSPLEMASAFSVFAAGGVRYEPFAVWRVEDAFGQVLEEHIVSGAKVLDGRTAYQIVDMMEGVVDYGTGEVIRKMGFNKPAAGKTGTTNGYKDAWFTGFTPNLSTSVWVGYDHETGLKDSNGAGITGGRGAAPIWTRFMSKATEGEPPRPFLQPPGVRFETVDPTTGKTLFWSTSEGMRVVVKE
ncbi:MAG: PBP1A family penicillin-binding protein [Desulfobacteraceae bacterium]|nr:PBP1A family penicillin-binding protein [Desulfobacteraceae bacterium]